MANSGAQAWKEKFDANAYLNTFYGQDMFNDPNRFLGDYFSAIARKIHKLMENSKCRWIQNHPSESVQFG